MDDYKRGLYMQALRELHEEKIRRTFQTESEYRETFLCEVLKAQLALESGITSEIWYNFEGETLESVYGYTEQIMPEFFPEFYALFDGTGWSKFTYWSNYLNDFEYKIRPLKVSPNQAWWSSCWLEARIRALDCILSDTH